MDAQSNGVRSIRNFSDLATFLNWGQLKMKKQNAKPGANYIISDKIKEIGPENVDVSEDCTERNN